MAYLIPRIDFPEIVIGLVAPIGTPLRETVAEFHKHFSHCGYRVVEIKVTDVFQLLKKYIIPEIPLDEKNQMRRYNSFIAYGNKIRKELSESSVLAALTISRVVANRIEARQQDDQKFTKTVYILNQFKRPEEIGLLRAVYGKAFFQVSVYSRRSARVDYLARRFAEDAGDVDLDRYRGDAEKLVSEDQNQQKELFGQRIGKIFHEADLIVNSDISNPNISDQVSRFFEILFSSNSYTPTKMEYGMFAAKSAALRTSDLSRQVGAAIFTPAGEVLALGSNEVPKANGGTYWPDEPIDDREFRRAIDSNDARKQEILREVLTILGKEPSTLDTVTRKKLEDATLMDALEYGRIVHAEMSAISDAARLGRSIQGARLFSTTFPCHMCAKHIVASGVKEVIFLEPYPKSLAARLHNDSIEVEGQDRGKYEEYPSVEFIHFYGITPRRYREFFERFKRKDRAGRFEPYIDNFKRPFIDLKSPFYAQLEDTVMESVKAAVNAFGVSI